MNSRTTKILGFIPIPTLVAIGIWVGTINATVNANSTTLSQTRAEVKEAQDKAVVPATQIAVLQSQMSDVQDTQKKQDEKLDRILERLPRR